jgi:hypothetical protein
MVLRSSSSSVTESSINFKLVLLAGIREQYQSSFRLTGPAHHCALPLNADVWAPAASLTLSVPDFAPVVSPDGGLN